jgi:hypothetical protein
MMTAAARQDRRARLKVVVSASSETETIARILRTRREPRIARKRRQAYRAEEEAWTDITGALAIETNDNPARLLEACRLGKVRHRFRHTGRWWQTKPARSDVLQRATIFEKRLIGADGSDLENEQWQFEINVSDWRQHVGRPSPEAATPLMAEGDAPHQAEQSDISNKSDVETPAPTDKTKQRATKRATLESYAAHQHTHLADTREYASREEDEAWAKSNGYVGHHVRDVLRQEFYDGLPQPERDKFRRSRRTERSA